MKPEHTAIIVQCYYDDGSGKAPRYYQIASFNRTFDAIARGENRLLLVMATGTALTKVANHTVDKSFEIYLCLYQAVACTGEVDKLYKQFSRDFFDLVTVDACHRGSAADDVRWRQVLEPYSSATNPSPPSWRNSLPTPESWPSNTLSVKLAPSRRHCLLTRF